MTVLHFTRMSPKHNKWHAVIAKHGAESVMGLWLTRCGLVTGTDSEKKARIPAPLLCKSCERLLAGDEKRKSRQ